MCMLERKLEFSHYCFLIGGGGKKKEERVKEKQTKIELNFKWLQYWVSHWLDSFCRCTNAIIWVNELKLDKTSSKWQKASVLREKNFTNFFYFPFYREKLFFCLRMIVRWRNKSGFSGRSLFVEKKERKKIQHNF